VIHPRVTIGLPTRNGERHIRQAAQSVLEQDYDSLELVISDNASDDGTEEICRDLARSDSRVRYHRQPENIGLVPNFNAALHLARGTYVKWLGDHDWLTPTYVPRCVEVLDDDPSLILVTTQQGHVGSGDVVETARYEGAALRSDRPVERFEELLRICNESHLLIDPLYGMVRRARVVPVPRPIMVYEDQVFAARLALAGPFGHIGEVLSFRREGPFARKRATARRLGVPVWQAHVATLLQCRQLLSAIRVAELDAQERRDARSAVLQLFVRRQQVMMAHRTRRLADLVFGRDLSASAPRIGDARGAVTGSPRPGVDLRACCDP
jgi:glycosyltransferase involved in cell wall biosynthesis